MQNLEFGSASRPRRLARCNWSVSRCSNKSASRRRSCWPSRRQPSGSGTVARRSSDRTSPPLQPKYGLPAATQRLAYPDTSSIRVTFGSSTQFPSVIEACAHTPQRVSNLRASTDAGNSGEAMTLRWNRRLMGVKKSGSRKKCTRTPMMRSKKHRKDLRHHIQAQKSEALFIYTPQSRN